jgi:hypothetical protein
LSYGEGGELGVSGQFLNGERGMQRLLLGPILYARESSADEWTFDVAILLSEKTATPPCKVVVTPSSGSATVAPARCGADFSRIDAGIYWYWRVTLPRRTDETRARYAIQPIGAAFISGLLASDEYTIVVPKKGQLPRILFFSCNGFSEAQYMERVADHYALWKHAFRAHKAAAQIAATEGEPDASVPTDRLPPNPDLRGGYHMMIGGGDQIYADSLWFTVKELHSLGETSRQERPKLQPPADLDKTLLQAYIDLYVLRWSRPEIRRMWARLPGAFMWDDHEIFDGWGSYPPELHDCPFYQAIYRAARATFEAFQLCGSDTARQRKGDGSHALQALTFEGAGETLDLLLLDLRTDRRLDLEHNTTRVMSEQQWRDLDDWLGERSLNRTTRRHVVVVSTIPVVYMRFTSWQESVAVAKELDDDLRDQWESACHRGERLRLITKLLAHASLTNSQITLLSGDVHVGARGRIVTSGPAFTDAAGRSVCIEQLTSSGIVHPAPGPWEAFAMRTVAVESDDEVSANITAKLLSFVGDRYLRGRNYMTLDFDTHEAPPEHATRLWARWSFEPDPFKAEIISVEPQVVVEAFNPSGPAAAAVPRAARVLRLRGAPERRPDSARARKRNVQNR